VRSTCCAWPTCRARRRWRTPAAEWFRAIVAILFGSLDPVTKQRLIRELFLLVPKKNSKTTNGALMMLTALLLNERPRASFFMTAPVQDVADLAFSAVSGAIQLDPVLDRKFHIRDHLKTIVHRETKATLDIMTFDPSVVTGLKVSGGALIDELHEIAKMSKAPKALRQMRGGMLPFPEAFLAFITTQSDGRRSGFQGRTDRRRATSATASAPARCCRCSMSSRAEVSRGAKRRGESRKTGHK
jgi:phage terminase large subunit-like protein